MLERQKPSRIIMLLASLLVNAKKRNWAEIGWRGRGRSVLEIEMMDYF